jgi:hypothetical protein
MRTHCLFVAFCLGSLGCSAGNPPVANNQPPTTAKPAVTSSRAYKGHQNDRDVNTLVGAFPKIRASRLDDCQTCHKGGVFTAASGGKSTTEVKNPCDYCHLVQHPSRDYKEAQPRSFAETLNGFGADYKKHGRSDAALQAIRGMDSDADGFANGAEIDALKYPGDPLSKPGQHAPPMKTLSAEQLRSMPHASELILANLARHRDYYATYSGVKLRDLLAAVGVNPSDPAIQGITVVAPDGYLKDFPAEKVNKAYPPQLFFSGLDAKALGNECEVVKYPALLPAGLSDGAPIPGEAWLMLAWERDGAPLDPSKLDITSGKTEGEGPYRIVVPQSVPAKPDRGSPHSPSKCNDGNDFDPARDHNAGDMVKGVVAIRINPMPAGYEDFDSKNGGWAYVTSGTLIVYGYGIR